MLNLLVQHLTSRLTENCGVMTILDMPEWVGIYCDWSPSQIISVIGDTGVNLNSLYVHRPRKENVFKNIRGNGTFYGYVTSKPSSTYHTYISFFVMVKNTCQLGKKPRRRKKSKKKKKVMMVGFLDGVNVRHKCASRGRSVIQHLCSVCQERTENAWNEKRN
jgi:hypothetical protein